jgi:two-component system sensor histidine kinase/response regulator
MTELTLDTDLTPEQRENLEIVGSATGSLLSVINDLLDFSKIEAGKLEIDSVEFDPRKHVAEILTLLAQRAHAKGLELLSRIDPEVPDRLCGDPARLRQILVNLVGNAIKFTERGEVVVEANLAGDSREEGNTIVCFRVTDTGIGIPSHLRKSIFDPFKQADGSTTRRFGGTGLGLSISSQLVSLMGGRIWVESVVGVGSSFFFTVLFSRSQARRSTEQELADLPVEGMRVLVVDDDPVNRRFLERTLTRWRMVPTLADGARAATSHLERAREAGTAFSLVLIADAMPEMDGFTLAEQIKGDRDVVKNVLMMLSYPYRSGIPPRSAGGDITILGGATSPYLSKPVDGRALKAAIRSILFQKSGASHLASISDAGPGQHLHILIAEDNPFNQRVALLILKKLGHSVVIVDDGQKAIAALERESFDLVLMDLQMPTMDGFQATTAIRVAESGTGRHIPIIALTAYARAEDRNRCLAVGMDDYVSKPIQQDLLRRAIEDCAYRTRDTTVTELAPTPFESPMDVAAALSRLDGDRVFLAKMAATFRDEGPRLLLEAQSGIDSLDAVRTGTAVHGLRNWIANFVAPAAFAASQAVESALGANDLTAARGLLPSLRHQLQQLEPDLNRLASGSVNAVEKR